MNREPLLRRGSRAVRGGRVVRRRTGEAQLGSSAAAVAALRAAALLRGGVVAANVWRLLGEEPSALPELTEIAELVAQGHDSAAVLAARAEPEWRVLAAAWALAQRSGAPVALLLERVAEALNALDRLKDRRSVLLAGPRATIRLVSMLPLVALLLGMSLGFDPWVVLLSPVGVGLAACGGLLLCAGVCWARLLVDRLAATDWVAGLECELCWIALAGGASQDAALRSVADAIDQLRVEWVRLAALCRDGPVREVLRAAARHGTPAGPMLLAEASAARARAQAELERQAERLAVRVLLPIGVCVLPAFIVLGVLPVLFAVLGSLGPVV